MLARDLPIHERVCILLVINYIISKDAGVRGNNIKDTWRIMINMKDLVFFVNKDRQ